MELCFRATDPGGAWGPAPAYKRQQQEPVHYRLHQFRQPLSDEGRECAAQVYQAAGASVHQEERGGGGERVGLRHLDPGQDAGKRSQTHREFTGENGNYR